MGDVSCDRLPSPRRRGWSHANMNRVMGTHALKAPSRTRPPKDARGRDIELAPVRPLLVRIVARWNPHQIWLFGSRARGDGRPTSDWDLLVVVPDELAEVEFDPLIGWRMQKEAGIRADVIPCRVSEFRDDRATPNTICYEVVKEGVLLYER